MFSNNSLTEPVLVLLLKLLTKHLKRLVVKFLLFLALCHHMGPVLLQSEVLVPNIKEKEKRNFSFPTINTTRKWARSLLLLALALICSFSYGFD